MQKFFIIGCPRSGTTMVQQALNRHSQIAIPPETKFFFSFFGQSLKQQLRHIGRLEADLHIRLPRPTTAVRSAAEGRAFYETLAGEYVSQLGKNGVVYFGEKTPEHTGHLPAVRQLYPEAKILVLYRDGRDVAASLSKMPWMTPNLYVNFLVWLYYNRVLQDAKALGCPNMYFARYEDVVADPERELGGILRFLDLPYQPAVAQGFGNREGVPEREFAWKARALEPITPARVGVFRSELTADQIAILERLGRHALPALGYELVTDGQKLLSAAFYLQLSYALTKFVARLPWRSVLKEMISRVVPCPQETSAGDADADVDTAGEEPSGLSHPAAAPLEALRT